jgi:lipoprotein NlpI
MNPFFIQRSALLQAATAVFATAGTLASVAAIKEDAPFLEAFRAQENALSRAIEQSPNSIGLYSRRGDMRQFLGKFEGAVADYEKMIALDPMQDAPHWRLGIAYYFTGAYEKGAKQFEKYHAYDNRDRENGVWKFLCQVRAQNLETARKEMLTYTRFDREPFPSLYAMLAGEKSPEEVLKESESREFEKQPQVRFFAKYYAGVYLSLTGKVEDGSKLVREAVEIFTPETAGNGGPGYMWQVARLHAREIAGRAAKPE